MNNTIQTNQSFQKFKVILTARCINLNSQMYYLIANHCKLNCFSHVQGLLINKLQIQYTIGSCKLNSFSCAQTPGRKKYSLLRDKYFQEDSRNSYFHSKYLNMRSEWENIKECDKYPHAILNICRRGSQLRGLTVPAENIFLLYVFMQLCTEKKENIFFLFKLKAFDITMSTYIS